MDTCAIGMAKRAQRWPQIRFHESPPCAIYHVARVVNPYIHRRKFVGIKLVLQSDNEADKRRGFADKSGHTIVGVVANVRPRDRVVALDCAIPGHKPAWKAVVGCPGHAERFQRADGQRMLWTSWPRFSADKLSHRLSLW